MYDRCVTTLARRLRRIVHLVLALSIVVAALAFLPGERVYEETNGCFGQALASLGTTEHLHPDCTPAYRLDRTEPAGGAMVILLVAAIALGAGIVYRRPTRWTAWLWVVWSVAATIGMFMMSFELRLFEHVETLWAAHVLRFALGMIGVLVVIATPVVATFTRERATGSLPSATDRSRNP